MIKIKFKSKMVIPLLIFSAVLGPSISYALTPVEFSVMTWNVGTNSWVLNTHETKSWNRDKAYINSKYYGNNLAWVPAENAAARHIKNTKPDIIALQELYDYSECHGGCSLWGCSEFVCNVRSPGDLNRSQIDLLTNSLGEEYYFMVSATHPDNGIAVRKSFGEFVPEPIIADDSVILGNVLHDKDTGDHPGRITYAHIKIRKNNRIIRVVNIHANGTFNDDAKKARKRQFDHLFYGDVISKEYPTIIMGDFNTDPTSWKCDTKYSPFDDYTDDIFRRGVKNSGLKFLSDPSQDRPATSISGLKFDHVVGSPNFKPIAESIDGFPFTGYFDHKPVRVRMLMY